MAVAVESVAEVLETDSLVRLAWSPPQVAGMCSYHTDVIPVVVLGPLARGLREDVAAGQDEAAATSAAEVRGGIDGGSRSVVLILKTEQGAWGIRMDAEATIMSRESPEFHSPRSLTNGPVQIGTVRFAETCYAILDAEATWRGLRWAICRWAGLMSESNTTSPSPAEDAPIPADRADAGPDRSH
jgi:purine-binding chemotaxis protein CheW